VGVIGDPVLRPHVGNSPHLGGWVFDNGATTDGTPRHLQLQSNAHATVSGRWLWNGPSLGDDLLYDGADAVSQIQTSWHLERAFP
jgi:hypothetical protein